MDEPITASEARRHLRVDSTADDASIQGFIAAARDWVEGFTGLFLVEREISETLSALGPAVRVRAWPIAADQPVTISYRDSAGLPQTIDTATVVSAARPAILLPFTGTRWPSGATAIVATFTAGYSDPDRIPAALKQAMLVMLTAFYEDREGGDLFAKAERCARSLCRSYRWRAL